MTAKSELQNYLTRIIEHDIMVDTTPDKGGTGRYIRPHELLEAAVAACMNISLRMEMKRNNLNPENVETKVKLIRDNPEKSIFEYSFICRANELENEKLLKIKEALYKCPVRKTLSKEIVFVEK